jgi:DNA-binding transcriptional ArsR family regulator
MGTKEATEAIRVMANPIAYRLLATIGMRGPQTTAELARVHDDVPTSSLYRQLARLRNAGLLRVVAERQARGAVERTYAVASRGAATFDPKQFAKLPVAQLRATLRNFLATMVADVSTYVEGRAFARDPSQTRAALAICKLTDDEYATVLRDVNAALTRFSDRKPPASAKRRYVYLIALPEAVRR